MQLHIYIYTSESAHASLSISTHYMLYSKQGRMELAQQRGGLDLSGLWSAAVLMHAAKKAKAMGVMQLGLEGLFPTWSAQEPRIQSDKTLICF